MLDSFDVLDDIWCSVNKKAGDHSVKLSLVVLSSVENAEIATVHGQSLHLIEVCWYGS